jgi:hypothetical protein
MTQEYSSITIDHLLQVFELEYPTTNNLLIIFCAKIFIVSLFTAEINK